MTRTAAVRLTDVLLRLTLLALECAWSSGLPGSAQPPLTLLRLPTLPGLEFLFQHPSTLSVSIFPGVWLECSVCQYRQTASLKRRNLRVTNFTFCVGLATGSLPCRFVGNPIVLFSRLKISTQFLALLSFFFSPAHDFGLTSGPFSFPTWHVKTPSQLSLRMTVKQGINAGKSIGVHMDVLQCGKERATWESAFQLRNANTVWD